MRAVAVTSLALALELAVAAAQTLSFADTADSLLLVSPERTLPILSDSRDPAAVHLAIQSFVGDLVRVTDQVVEVYNDTLPVHVEHAIVVGTTGSRLIEGIPARAGFDGAQASFQARAESLKGQREAFDIRWRSHVSPQVKEAIVVEGSDKRGVIYALYTLSEELGVSPFHWWADVPVPRHQTVSFPHDAVLAHGEPTVKYRGFFLNDEQPVLWDWARDLFKMGNEPPFQVGMYERVFELLLRLKGNYLWPAMWESMFAIDGLDVSHGKPKHPMAGPNQLIADRMGVIMGTSHHEPMATNQKEHTDFGRGAWDFVKNRQYLEDLWTYGAERAKELDVVWTVGMRGDGDAPYEGANGELLKNITAAQQDILRKVLGKDDLKGVPQMWAMYKEVQELFNDGLEIPPEVTPLFSDDNYGNLQTVLPANRTFPAGAGIYYHADYVGYPRSYKWINTVSLPKMWEQMNIAQSFNMTEIWILNVGDLKMLEIPLEYFMNLAYDFERTTKEGLESYLVRKCVRDYGASASLGAEMADIMLLYSQYASRRKAELLDENTYSLVDYNEWDRIVDEWEVLAHRAEACLSVLDKSRHEAFEEMVLVQIRLQLNLHQMYHNVALANLHATQGRSSTNLHARKAIELFERDFDIIDAFHASRGGKWNHTLAQTHIGYQYWQMPVRNSLPPVSYISPRSHAYARGNIVFTRYIPEGSRGAWPGDNMHNNAAGHSAPDPTLLPMDPYGRARYVDVASGGWKSVDFSAKADVEWLKVTPCAGEIKGDGSSDTRVWIEVDWERAPGGQDHGPVQGVVVFTATDGTHVNVTAPLAKYTPPPRGFKGAVQGDGYVAIEAAHYTAADRATVDGETYAWTEVPHLGRTMSGLTILPPLRTEFTSSDSPTVTYAFWVGHAPDADADADAETDGEIIIHLSPSLNYLPHTRSALSVQLDDGPEHVIEPVPENVENDIVGFLPPDWQETVAREVRVVRVPIEVKGGAKGEGEGERKRRLGVGEHKVVLRGVRGGVVVQRVIVDLGGLKGRGESYLGPPESVLVGW